MVLTGYPVEDLVFRESFVAASRTRRAAAGRRARDGWLRRAGRGGGLPRRRRSGQTGLRLHRDRSGRETRWRCCIAARCAARYFKHHLPNYGVFDEDRYFVPGDSLTVLRAGWADGSKADVALTICEDIWQAGGPFAVAGAARVGLVLNINGSPYELNKDDLRLPLVQRRAAEAGATVAYVNTVGGQDELVFDGDSMIVAADGDAAGPRPAARRGAARARPRRCPRPTRRLLSGRPADVASSAWKSLRPRGASCPKGSAR